jgi:hypothetical protein
MAKKLGNQIISIFLITMSGNECLFRRNPRENDASFVGHGESDNTGVLKLRSECVTQCYEYRCM